jgi:hypothetical protein
MRTQNMQGGSYPDHRLCLDYRQLTGEGASHAAHRGAAVQCEAGVGNRQQRAVRVDGAAKVVHDSVVNEGAVLRADSLSLADEGG